MTYYVIEVRDSDGNDCSVFDAIVQAPTRKAASERLWAHLSKAYPKDESDGGYGTYHACDCHCDHRKTMVCARCADSWECSHGGLLTNEDVPDAVQEFETFAQAEEACARYHSKINLTDEEN